MRTPSPACGPERSRRRSLWERKEGDTMTREECIAAVKEVQKLMCGLYACKERYTPCSDSAEEEARKLLVLDAENDPGNFAEYRKRRANQLRAKVEAFLEETEER